MTDDEIKAKIKNMRYDTDRKRYIGDDGSELQITPYSNGRGYKVDYYESTTYGNAPHNSTHIQTDISGNWERTDNDRTNGTQTHSSGSGCYITSACMEHFQDEFDDNCHELTVLRWFRDNFVSDEDVELYYSLAPTIVILTHLKIMRRYINTYMKMSKHVLKLLKIKIMILHTLDIKVLY